MKKDQLCKCSRYSLLSLKPTGFRVGWDSVHFENGDVAILLTSSVPEGNSLLSSDRTFWREISCMFEDPVSHRSEEFPSVQFPEKQK